MDPEVLSAIIAGSISLVVSTAAAAWAPRRKLESECDAALRAERLSDYRMLRRHMEPIRWYGQHEITAERPRNCLPISTTGILKGEVDCSRTSGIKALKDCNGPSTGTLV